MALIKPGSTEHNTNQDKLLEIHKIDANDWKSSQIYNL